MESVTAGAVFIVYLAACCLMAWAFVTIVLAVEKLIEAMAMRATAEGMHARAERIVALTNSGVPLNRLIRYAPDEGDAV